MATSQAFNQIKNVFHCDSSSMNCKFETFRDCNIVSCRRRDFRGDLENEGFSELLRERGTNLRGRKMVGDELSS